MFLMLSVQFPSSTSRSELKRDLPASFVRKKERILSALSVPVEAYHDLSLKDSIDIGIRDLIDEINAFEGFVTTSSCAGRVSVFLEGVKRESLKDGCKEDVGLLLADEQGPVDGEGDVATMRSQKLAATGGKGGGGQWLFVSHDKMDLEELGDKDVVNFLGMDNSASAPSGPHSFINERLIHFKFEPMVSADAIRPTSRWLS